jgi:hypothetical protein
MAAENTSDYPILDHGHITKAGIAPEVEFNAFALVVVL